MGFVLAIGGCTSDSTVGTPDGGDATAPDAASPDGGSDASTADTGADATPTDAGDAGVACNTKLRAGSAFSLAANTTATECWSFDISAQQKEHVVAVHPQVATSAVRSLAVYHAATTSYTSTPTTCTPLSVMSPLVYLWQPGAASSFDLPPQAGFAIDAGVNHFVVQITYENTGSSAQQDSSGVDFCTTTSLRANDADIVAFGTTKISIPPNTSSVQAGCTATLDSTFNGMNTFAALPHANQYATAIGLSQNQNAIVSGAYSWTNAPWASATATLHTGDAIATSCTYNNPTGTTINLGWTSGETCFVFVAYYPKQPFANAWAQPLTEPGCP